MHKAATYACEQCEYKATQKLGWRTHIESILEKKNHKQRIQQNKLPL